jgi:N-acetylglucosamine-6-phosphate deacetylase
VKDRRLWRADTVVGPDGAGPGWVEITDERIAATGRGAPPRRPDRDLGDAVLAPGFVDLHCHGGAGAAFPDGDPDEALRAVAFHRAHGTTTLLASLVAAAPAELRRAVDGLAGLVSDGELAGLHLEGPWLAAGRCGAHDPTALRDPNPGELDRLLGTGAVRMVTLAPERAGGLDAIRRVTAAGPLAAVGHTDATCELTCAAIAAGARIGTHLFNAMAPVHHRDPGPIVALLEDERVTVELINDGTHLHPAVLELAFAGAGADRVAFITDAMGAAGMGDGRYPLGPLEVEVRDGVARLVEGGSIAGSTLTLDHAFRRAVTIDGLPVEDAVRALSANPARLLGIDDRTGSLETGKHADLVVLDADFHVAGVMRQGEWVVRPDVP